jgi:hypothetical protein
MAGYNPSVATPAVRLPTHQYRHASVARRAARWRGAPAPNVFSIVRKRLADGKPGFSYAAPRVLDSCSKIPVHVVKQKGAKRRRPTTQIEGVPKPLNLETIRWRAVVVAIGQGQRLRHLSRAGAGKLAGMRTRECSALVPCALTPTTRRSRRGMRRRRAPRVPRVELLSNRGIGNGHHATGLGDGVVGNELAVPSGATGTQQNQGPAA